MSVVRKVSGRKYKIREKHWKRRKDGEKKRIFYWVLIFLRRSS